MLSPSEFQALVSGRRRGVGAASLRTLLRLAEIPYTSAVRWRNRRFDAGKSRIHRVAVPVISVGNLTLGGTGKTPLVEWLARWLGARGVQVVLVSRGYGAPGEARNDEALELAQKLPGVPHLQNPDRVAAAREAIERFACQLILLDDAFQHRRLARDLDIVLVDALDPFGCGHVFPRGTLREPLSGVGRAQVVALSRADMVERVERERIRAAVRRHAPEAVWLEMAHAPERLLNASGRAEPLESLRGGQVAAFCGIGNPAGFRHTLDRCGYEVAGFREFADHYPFGRADIDELARWAGALDVAAVVSTHKDLVKLGVDSLGRRPLWALVIGLEILAGRSELEAKLLPLLPRVRVG